MTTSRWGVAVALLAAGLGLVGWLFYPGAGAPELSEAGARERAEAFLAEVRAGRADAAWAGTSSEFKSMQGRDSFRAFVRSKPALKAPAEFGACTFKPLGDLSVAECTFRPASGQGTITVVLHPDGAEWKVGRLGVG